MKFKKIKENVYQVEDLKEINSVIESFIRISSGGDIQKEVLEITVGEMIKYHVANLFFKVNIGFIGDIPIAKIIVPCSEVNVKSEILRKDLVISVSEVIANKDGLKLRLCGKVNK